MDRLAELKSGAADYEKKTAESRALIVKILDEMSFVETDAFVSGETDFGRAAGEGVISGYGSIGGSKVCIFSQNISVFEGGLSARAADKIVKVMTNAGKCGAPLISIFDTKGARIDGGIDVLEGYAKILKAVSDIDGSALHIAVVKGSNYGMLSAAAQMADFCIMYDKAVMAPLSPLVLSQGKDASDIGSAKALSESGECTHVVKSDEELSALIYKLVNYFGGGCGCG